ncbi:SDR family NAD(P)-dependent oxidoreductase [Malikia sp.]|uniref:SDR family NAD(P)-dependent oxidoreductase n=1 Tax=Malikia sp. TaxID=2070706 RepID=UPI00261F1AE6|nr:SDR family NAD(P)-dependent oxidoreductase [Malikia sp.]MDD2730324.1 SDR family NAD(P)-dependent oxidoreductase [Malikia sp.]
MNSPQDLTILTGASRGMGLAMARQLLRPGHLLLCLSRHLNDELAHEARAAGAHLEQWSEDLSDAGEAVERLERWLHSLHAPALNSATLINNAGLLPAIVPLQDCPADELVLALRVGLEAPMLLSGAFLRATQAWVDAGWQGERKLLNISSGLGRRAMASQSPYCAAKAGLDHFSRCVALEQAQRPHGAKVVALAPGVIATGMQVQLRAADPQGFPDRARFVGLHEQGLLASPEQAAAQVLAWLDRPDFGQDVIADVRDAS